MALAVGMSEAEADQCFSVKCTSDVDCSGFGKGCGPGITFRCCEFGECGPGVGYCCSKDLLEHNSTTC
ncbi:hypothetical protein SUGI_0530510 [Cryptomeria japonica]|nr:hypothetical protein SUGI_0530510 [Cryptomeria japonica]